MPNNTRTQPDGTWTDGYSPPSSDWEDLERKIFGAWNGDQGGAYAAPQPAGSGYTFNGAGLQVTTQTRLTYGGCIRGGASAFTIPDGTWPLVGETHSLRARSIVQALDTFLTNKKYLWSRNHPYGGIGSVALSCRGTNERTIEQPEFYAPLRVVDGSTLKRVTLTFRVAQRRTLAPRSMPRMRILRVPVDSVSNAPAPLKATADGLGFDFLPLVTSPDAWYADGAAQSFEYVCDQNNTIDTASYSYLIHIIEEVGTINPDQPFDGITFIERKPAANAVIYNTSTLNGSPVYDGGVGVAALGNRMLVVDPDSVLATGTTTTNSSKNGLWIVPVSGDWTRTEDCDDASDFSPNWIVTVNRGAVNSGATWQCQSPSSAARINLLTAVAASATKTQIRMVPAEPHGNIYHSVTPEFEVRDFRFQ